MNGEGAGAGATGAAEGGDGGAQVVFRKVAVKDSSLWETKRIQPDMNRVHLRTMEAILDPTVSADNIIGAVAYAATSHGLRVTQREYGRIVAQRVEAPYLASVSSGSWRSGGGQEREEWRMVAASLGVSKGVGKGKAVERVLSVSFLTDPVPKPTDLAGKGAAAMSSLLGSVGAVAATFGSSIMSGPNGGEAAGKTSGRAARVGAGAEATSLTAVEIANLRSEQRADSLARAMVAELGKVGWGGGVPDRRRTGSAATAAAVPASAGSSPEEQERAAEKDEGAVGDGGGAGGTESADDVTARREEEMVLAPFDGSNGGRAVAAGAAASNPLPAGGESERGEGAEERRRSVGSGGQGAEEGGDGVGTAGATAETFDSGTAVVEVRVCLQFVEGVCARAEEYSRHDAAETWKPLQETVSRLERNNATLRSLLEIQYRTVGAAPPPVPNWSGRRTFGETDGSWLGSAALNAGNNAPSSRVVALLRPSPLFVIEGKWVKARAVAVPATAAGTAKHDGGGSGEREVDSPASTAPTGAAAAAAAAATDPAPPGRNSRQNASSVRAAVKTLADVVGCACEAREEAFLKARLPGAQAYTVELERYRAAIVGGGALRAVASAGRDGGGGRGDGTSVEVDDDLWRLFGAQETRLYACSAALGKKPGRIYVTYNTLWFHSKVLGFESRLALPLAEVRSITLLAAALDLSSSIVIATESNGVTGELMLVFPGRKRRQVEPLEVLLRELAVMAGKEKSAAEAEVEASAASAKPGISI